MSEEQASGLNMNDVAQKITKGNKVAGIIIAILMIVLGVLFFAKPLLTGLMVEIFATIGFLIYGVYQIILYIRSPKEARNGGSLAFGILLIVVAILILLSSFLNIMVTFAFLLGFLAIFMGINQVSAFSALKAAGEKGAGWPLASGIINILLGVFLIVTPIAATIVVDYVLGIYLVVGGVALLINSASGNPGGLKAA